MAKLAQAIVHGPELVVLDEPTNGLDPAARRRMLKLVGEMKNEQGMSVLVCSHLLRDIEQVCDEAVIMKDGVIVHQCNLEEERRSNRCFVELEVTGDDRNLRAALPEIGAEGVSEGGGRWRIVLPAGVEVEAIWGLVARQNLLVRKLTHRRDTLEEIFLKAMGHLAHTPGRDGRRGGLTAREGRDGGLQTRIPAIPRPPHRALDAVHGVAPLRLAEALPAAAGPPAHDAGSRLARPVRRLHLSHQSRGAAAGARAGVPSVHPGRRQVLLDLHVRPGGLRGLPRGPGRARPALRRISRTTRFRSTSAGRSRAGATPSPG